MMRYQRVSPDCLPLSNGRKPNLRTCKEDSADSRSTLNYSNGFEGKALRFRPANAQPSGQDQNFSQFVVSHSLKTENPNVGKNSHDRGPGGDALLQWGQNKRSRGSRADNRLVSDESSIRARQAVKNHRRVVSSRAEKQATAMPPPCVTTSPYSRGASLRASTPVRETTGSPLSRSIDERSVPGNGQPSSNSRVHSRSVDKRSRSPPSLDEPDKAPSCSVTGVSEKPNEPIAQANPMNVESKAQTQLESAAVEKVNLDSFEWPRIYISLSRKEKEDDFLAMKGTKLPQRPKKRAKNIDRNLQYCFPGMWLSDLSRGRYEVREKKCVKKQKRRGLKGMESVGSDSD